MFANTNGEDCENGYNIVIDEVIEDCDSHNNTDKEEQQEELSIDESPPHIPPLYLSKLPHSYYYYKREIESELPKQNRQKPKKQNILTYIISCLGIRRKGTDKNKHIESCTATQNGSKTFYI